ncbi:MAG: EAL domain-containing protein [Moraxellaceae bacterium]|nr:EAL domain-containing protein [Moraxellaceae bacterium]
MNRLAARFHNATFRQQITLTVTAGVFILAFLASLASTLHSSTQTRQTLLRQGAGIAERLAEQSRLALLVGSAENVAEAVSTTFSFPDVMLVEVVDDQGRSLLRKARPGLTWPASEGSVTTFANKVVLAFENESSWGLQAAVAMDTGMDGNPFELGDATRKSLGSVRIVLSKDSLTALRDNIFITNLVVAVVFALAFLVVIRTLTERLTRPVAQLSANMHRAELGERDVRADVRGARDIADMSRAFNSMMSVLEEREQQLIASRDMAVAFASMKAQFASTVSHEIRTPLNGVIGTLDMLIASRLPQHQHQLTELAWSSARYLLELVNDVLDFSKLEAGKLELAKQPVDLVQVVEEVLDTLAPQAFRKGLDLGYAPDGALDARVLGDARRLRQVLTNIVGNAVKFTDHGSVSVLLRTGPVTDGHRTIRIEVQDTGPGIAPAMQKRIFDSFTQGDSLASRRHEGSGLGLAICRQLVDLMGGKIGVDSQQGSGSCFWIDLTLPVASSGTPVVPTPEKRALLVNDSPVNQAFCRAWLPYLGYACHTCPDATQAQKQLIEAHERNQPWDAILFDLDMPASSTEQLLAMRAGYPMAALHWVALAQPMRTAPRDVDGAAHWNAVVAKPLRVQRLRHGLSAQTGLQTAQAPLLPSTGGRFADLRVLVIEDHRSNQIVMHTMLGMLGVRCEVAGDGPSALAAVERQSWDIVLLDCQMPGMDGYQIARTIRSMEQASGARVPIVAISANVAEEDIRKCLDAGMDAHLGKPITLDALRATLLHWLPQRNLGDALHGRSTATVLAGDASIDSNVIGRMQDALGGALNEAIEPFLEDTRDSLPRLRDALQRQDFDALGQHAHRIKGAAGNLGVLRLAESIREVEAHARHLPVDQALALLDRVEGEFAQAELTLRELLVATPQAIASRHAESARVMVVDDDRSTRNALRYALQLNGIVVDEAENGRAALEVLERVTPDLVLMDAMMPEMDGIAACAVIKSLPHGRDIPVLMITALDDRHSVERAFAAGASDYITKPLHFNVVVQRVRRSIEAVRAERHVRHLAYNDPLTGLPNRTLFVERLKQRIEHSRRQQSMLAVLFLDLDRFKFVNDSLGHESGDRLLSSVAQRIKNCVRNSDGVARLGGDEFTVLLDDLPNVQAAAAAAQKIASELAEPFHIDDHEVFVSASVGIAAYPQDGEDVSTLLRHADSAMYHAKRSNQGFAFYEAGMGARAGDHLRLENALRRAIERNELALHYQPQVDGAGRLYCAEALLRWQHPAHGRISPLEFIPLAEETGLIVPIGNWVLHEACAQLRQWIETGHREVRVAINLSSAQLRETSFIAQVEHALRDNGLSPRHLIFEITESVWMEQAGEAVSMLHQLRDMGIELAIDDFGTGYSSLSYLKRLPVDVLKIDKSFIDHLAQSESDNAIVRGIVALAHTLDLQVVAEGVEYPEQRERLAEMDCDYIQGYHISPPLTADDFAARVLPRESLLPEK